MKKPKITLPRYYGFASIVIVCALVLLLEMIFPDQMVYLIASSEHPGLLPLTLFTHMFMHAGFNHFFFNMFFTAGMAVYYERQIGSKRLIRDYVLCGLAAAIFFIGMPSLFGWQGMLGASGACSGLMALGLLSYKSDKLHEGLAMLFLIGLFMANLLPGIVDCLLPSGVAHMAHVGGILAGVVIHCFNKKERALEKPFKR